MDSRFLAIILIVIGLVLLIFGITAWQSFSSAVSRAVSGTPNSKAIVLLVLSLISLVTGSYILLKK